jgi:hypothetical protein
MNWKDIALAIAGIGGLFLTWGVVKGVISKPKNLKP